MDPKIIEIKSSRIRTKQKRGEKKDKRSTKWSLNTVRDHINSIHIKTTKDFVRIVSSNNIAKYNGLSNEVILCLFRFYSKLQTDIQNCLRIFYFGLEQNNSLRYNNITKLLKQHKIFKKYPWLNPEGSSIELPNSKGKDIDYESSKQSIENNDSKTSQKSFEEKDNTVKDNDSKITPLKPFSEACNQYEIEIMKSKNGVTEVNDYKPDQLYQPVDTLNQNLYIQHNVNSFKATSHASYTNNHLIQSFYSNMQIPLLRNEIPVDASQISTGTNTIDNNLLLCQEYEKMISAIECNYKSNATIVGSNISEDKFPNFSSMPSQNNSFEKIIPVTNCIVTKAKSNIVKKNKDKWLSTISKRKSNNLIVLPATKIKKTLEINTFTGKLTPIMHFEKRKIKLTAQVPLSLGDLIVLVSFFYKLEYIEQQLLIEKMKILEASKPNQAAYLRQYVRITCPTYNENNIHFTPIPPELVASETNLNLHNVKSIDDILEKDFCVSEDNIHEESTKIDANVAEVYNGCLSVNCNTSYEFDFGSEFL